MITLEYDLETHHLVLARVVEEAIAHMESGDIARALDALERAVQASEAYPSFLGPAAEDFECVESLVSLCARGRSHMSTPQTAARGLLDRIRTLKRSAIH